MSDLLARLLFQRQIVPLQQLHNLRVKLDAGAGFQKLHRLGQWQCLSVWTLRSKGIETINGSEQPRADRDSFAFQTVWVAAAVP